MLPDASVVIWALLADWAGKTSAQSWVIWDRTAPGKERTASKKAGIKITVRIGAVLGGCKIGQVK
jgi:hypothetical protein